MCARPAVSGMQDLNSNGAVERNGRAHYAGARDEESFMVDRVSIIPPSMQNIVDRAGYLPAVRAAGFVFCAGQVGRNSDLSVIDDPEQQFHACWDNLEVVLAEAGCTFDDVVEMTTFHVDLYAHIDLFRRIKDQRFPRGTCAWTCLGVSELAVRGLLVEIKCIAIRPEGA